jgi:hypothetical protein
MASDTDAPADNPSLATEFDEADPSVAVDLEEGVEDEGDEASNDMADDAALAAATPEKDDKDFEGTGAPVPAEVEDDGLDKDDDVVDPQVDIGNFAAGEGGRGLS